MDQVHFLTIADAVRNSADQFEKAISTAFTISVNAMTTDQKVDAFFPELRLPKDARASLERAA